MKSLYCSILSNNCPGRSKKKNLVIVGLMGSYIIEYYMCTDKFSDSNNYHRKITGGEYSKHDFIV